jgi:hypothetical protein
MKCVSDFSSLLTIILALAIAPFADAITPMEKTESSPMIAGEDHHDVSPPLNVLAQISPLVEAPVVALPLHHRPGAPIVSSEPDPVVQQATTSLAAVPVSNFITFAGLNNLDGLVPPDPNAAVGDSQIFETVNSHYQIFSTSGTSLLGPATLGSIWNGFGGQCDPTAPGTHVYSDPIVLRDKIAKRWFVSAIGSSSLAFNSNNTECIAVSTGTDATGSYARYAFSFGTTLNDYPKFGVWPDAYYASYNLFANGSSFTGVEVCAYNRSAMLSGSAATSVCFQRSTSDFSLLPADFDGVTLPPSGEPNFYLELGTSTSLKLYRFHVNFTTPSSSTFSGPVSITVASYSEACGGNQNCIPQSGGPALEGLGDRLLFPLSYRNFGDHESLVTDHSVAVGSSVGMRWYEIRSPNGTPTVFQQGTYAPDSNFRWMGSINMNGNADICLGYSVSSSTIFPSIRFTCRVPTDPLGTMESESTILNGGGAQTGASRWGDYTSMATNPADDLTFVYTNEIYRSSSSANWSTQIASFLVQ